MSSSHKPRKTPLRPTECLHLVLNALQGNGVSKGLCSEISDAISDAKKHHKKPEISECMLDTMDYACNMLRKACGVSFDKKYLKLGLAML